MRFLCFKEGCITTSSELIPSTVSIDPLICPIDSKEGGTVECFDGTERPSLDRSVKLAGLDAKG